MDSPNHLPCPNCFSQMEPIGVRHTYGQKVDIDICTRCHLVFFDKHEHRGLSAHAVLVLIERFKINPICESGPDSHLPICPRCGGDQSLIHDSTIHGAFRSHRCKRCETFTIKAVEFLRMMGVVEKVPDGELEQTDLVAHPRQCESCGAPAGPAHEACSFCGLPPLRFDRIVLTKLFASLDKEHKRALMADASAELPKDMPNREVGWHHNLSTLLRELTD